mmetsp:Transcript_36301/g.104474  ORF Transcript_36301/g.104474 Transcript_36301/m.104474 type:complete len:258 (-) Transcript_36301:870-1643(-)
MDAVALVPSRFHVGELGLQPRDLSVQMPELLVFQLLLAGRDRFRYVLGHQLRDHVAYGAMLLLQQQPVQQALEGAHDVADDATDDVVDDMGHAGLEVVNDVVHDATDNVVDEGIVEPVVVRHDGHGPLKHTSFQVAVRQPPILVMVRRDLHGAHVRRGPVRFHLRAGQNGRLHGAWPRRGRLGRTAGGSLDELLHPLLADQGRSFLLQRNSQSLLADQIRPVLLHRRSQLLVADLRHLSAVVRGAGLALPTRYTVLR